MVSETASTQRFDGRTCVITGASRGIGRGIALELAEHGANVVVNYRSSADAAAEVADRVESLGGSAMTVQADVTEHDEMNDMAEQVQATFGQTDVLINNAGITQDTRFENMTTEEWAQVLDVDLTGAFHSTKAFFEDIKAAEHGRLINISSIVGRQGNFGQVNYAAAKSGLIGFTRALALELAPHDSTANCVSPGFTRTEMIETIPDDIKAEIRDQIPLDRFADTDDIACATRFLASKDSGYMTGEVLDVTGGMDL
ncbi:MAG: beta-ketoacyl-ACP reductase [Halobacteriales archaeon]|nr:beta-ketoacyl-ACP reductase [Halobacteriales archaeon]